MEGAFGWFAAEGAAEEWSVGGVGNWSVGVVEWWSMAESMGVVAGLLALMQIFTGLLFGGFGEAGGHGEDVAEVHGQ